VPKFRNKKRSLSIVLVLIVFTLTFSVFTSCDGLDINPFDQETTTTSTTTEQQSTTTASELPGKTEFTTTEEPPQNGAILGSPGYDMFLYIEGLPGESTDDDHDNWIDVLSYSWGVSQPSAGSMSSGTSRSSERSLHLDFTVTKMLDKTSPKLALYCSNGQHITEAILVIRRADEAGTQIMQYRMTDLVISSVFVNGIAGQEMRPTEEIGLAYTQIEWIYTELNELGMAKGNVEAYWNLETNTGE